MTVGAYASTCVTDFFHVEIIPELEGVDNGGDCAIIVGIGD